jgi:hypothetical protein
MGQSEPATDDESDIEFELVSQNRGLKSIADLKRRLGERFSDE